MRIGRKNDAEKQRETANPREAFTPMNCSQLIFGAAGRRVGGGCRGGTGRVNGGTGAGPFAGSGFGCAAVLPILAATGRRWHHGFRKRFGEALPKLRAAPVP